MSDVKEHILINATDLMLCNGFHATSINDICSKSNILKGSFYHHFMSKTDLALEALVYDDSKYKMRLQRIFAKEGRFQPKLECFLSYVYKDQLNKKARLGKVTGPLPLILGAEMSAQDQRISDRVHEIIDYYEETYCRCLASTDAQAHPEIKAHNIICYISGLLTQARINNSLDSLKHVQVHF